MNKFLIFVTRSPFESLNGQTALSFCEVAVKLGHEVSQVFFYQQGVQQANEFIQPATGEQSQLAKWVTFSEQTKTPLNICVTAAIKRGVVSTEEAMSNGKCENIHPVFNAVGMSEYFAAMRLSSSNDEVSIKCIQF
jgi:tRNA 2-thiouridine synthesizing protein D